MRFSYIFVSQNTYLVAKAVLPNAAGDGDFMKSGYFSVTFLKILVEYA